jgi:hypothetical protein
MAAARCPNTPVGGYNSATFVSGSQQVPTRVHELQGYAIVLDKVAFITRVFEAEGDEGYQFNIRFAGDLLLTPRFPTRHEADLQRSLLLKALDR